ncbi:MAG: DUF971 domain-containing protein [Gammaproteobacteria bacterium]|nr:DUF971 domain-containing protein [Gammaproteobacteria bacterium]
MSDIRLEIQPQGLMIHWGETFNYLFHPLWLRENSNDPEYRDENIGARIPQAADHSLDIAIESAEIDTACTVKLAFSDGHHCEFPEKRLRACAEKHRPDDLIGDKVFWQRGFQDYPTYQLETLKNDESAVLAMLATLAKYGFAHVQGLAIDDGALKSLSDCVGPMRETNWGTLADVKNIPNPYDLTMTARSLAPHTDNPYRLPGPGYIFMQCLRNNAVGGESLMVDGFGVAMTLKSADPEAFESLTTIVPNFRHAEDSAVLEDSGPLIELNEAGEVARVRFSNRTEQVPPLSTDTLNRYYRGRKKFAELIRLCNPTSVTLI